MPLVGGGEEPGGGLRGVARGAVPAVVEHREVVLRLGFAARRGDRKELQRAREVALDAHAVEVARAQREVRAHVALVHRQLEERRRLPRVLVHRPARLVQQPEVVLRVA